jgi:hypothetical protein
MTGYGPAIRLALTSLLVVGIIVSAATVAKTMRQLKRTLEDTQEYQKACITLDAMEAYYEAKKKDEVEERAKKTARRKKEAKPRTKKPRLAKQKRSEQSHEKTLPRVPEKQPSTTTRTTSSAKKTHQPTLAPIQE